MKLLNNLASMRKDYGYSQSDLAFLVGVSKNTISNIEQGVCGPSASLAFKLCLALGCKFEDLFYVDSVSLI